MASRALCEDEEHEEEGSAISVVEEIVHVDVDMVFEVILGDTEVVIL